MTGILALFLTLAAPAAAQLYGEPPSYGAPELFLAPGPQSAVSLSAEELRAEIGVSTAADAEELVPAIFKWMSSSFSASAAGGTLIGKTTADGLLKSRSLSGCHDWALLFSSVLRKLGYPSLLVDAAGIKWAREYKGGGSFSGHVLAEAFIEGRWMLIDATSGRYVRNYDPSNPVIPLVVGPESAGLYAMFKGPDPLTYGITDNDALRGKMKEFAARLPGLKVAYPAYTVTHPPQPLEDNKRGRMLRPLSEPELTGECQQPPCKRHPCAGSVVQAGGWDLHVEKKGDVYYAHHYPGTYIFMEKIVKTLDFPTLQALNEYLASLN